MPLIHLPVQSGSDKILEAMNRKHTIKDYLGLIKTLTKVKPNIKFSSDFIIGYPGETDSDFRETIKLMDEVKFINSYSFIYSARPGTPAYDLKAIDPKKLKERLIEFQDLAEKIKTRYRENLINKTANVLFENKINNEKKYFGRDEFFNSVIVESDDNLTGTIENVKILKGNHNTLYGEIDVNSNQKFYAA